MNRTHKEWLNFLYEQLIQKNMRLFWIQHSSTKIETQHFEILIRIFFKQPPWGCPYTELLFYSMAPLYVTGDNQIEPYETDSLNCVCIQYIYHDELT